MKKLFQVACTLLLSSTLSAQTITIDGVNTDWSEVPMLTEPGVGPVVKMVVPQDGLTLPEGTAYALMVEGDHVQILANDPVIYTDADMSETTGESPWFCPSMGYDYEIAPWGGLAEGVKNAAGNICELGANLSAFTNVPLSGSFGAWLTFNWGALYIPTDPGTEGYKWSEATYHPMYVKPYAYADLKGTHVAADAYATHQALAPGATLNMKNAGSANDTLLWAAWTVELTKPATYVVTADVTAPSTATVDLYLVDVATNNVVATFISTDVWAPAGSAEYGEWDLSDVPAGKYMLKMKNHAAWSEMVFKSVTLVESYSINITAQDNNMGSVKVDKEIVNDNQISIIATANYGYHFTQWDDGNTDNPRSIVLTQDTSFVAHFAPNNYAISTQSSDAERGATSGNVTTTYLDYITISATANYGYHFTQWNDGNTDNPRKVQVSEDKTYTAYFDKNTYYITKNYDSNQGYVNGYSSGKYLDNITLTAEANYGYHFVQWSDGNTDNPRHFILTQDTAFSVEFAQTFSGQCGDNLYWSYQNNTLTISGFGEMYDERPWGLFTNEIQTVVLPNGIAHIGNDAFSDCTGLNAITIPYTVTSIGDYAFAGCRKLVHVNCYAINPPMAETTSFANYNVYLNVPCDNLQDYQLDMVFGSFKYIQCMEADSENVPTDDVVVTPGTNDVTITWPTAENADTYTIIIQKSNEVFCTLTFNADGQLLNIAFAPGRDGNHPAQFATKTTNGLRFTVTGLEEGTNYTYDIISKDENNESIETYSGEFKTQSNTPTDVGNLDASTSNVHKLLRNGHLIIVRDGVEHTMMGQEM